MTEATFTLSDISAAQRLALKGFRHAVTGKRRTILFTYQQMFGGDAVEVSHILWRFAHCLGVNARRRPQLHGPQCPCLSPSEISVMRLFSATARRDDGDIRALMAWLIPIHAADQLSTLAEQIVDHFMLRELDLGPLPFRQVTPDWPRPLTLCPETGDLPAKASG